MLCVENLTVAYGPVVALANVSLQVRECEIVCLLGSNGAGKTTLIRTVIGLKTPANGRLVYRGVDLAHEEATDRVRRGIAWVPEGRGVFAAMSVRDNLLMGAYSIGTRREVAAELDKVLNVFPVLAKRLDQIAGTMSGGEQQMLAFGRALMCRPQVVLMDEPSMGLAPVVVDHVFQIIEAINRQGIGVLLVEQNAHMALSVATRFYVLQRGEIGLQGEVRGGRLVVSNGAGSRELEESELESAYLGG